MRKLTFIGAVGCVMALLMALTGQRGASIGIDGAVRKFKEDAHAFAVSTVTLQASIARMQGNDSAVIVEMREALKMARLRYKSLESFLEYFFPTAAVTYNMAPRVEVEEPNIEFTEPTGLQVIESLLYEKDVYGHKRELMEQMDLISSSAGDIPALLFNFQGNDKQLLESLRLELIRVMAMGVVGFDAPRLKSGVEESYAVVLSMRYALQPFLKGARGEADSVVIYLDRVLAMLEGGKDFDTFDRLRFFTDCALPLQRHMGLWIRGAGMEINSAAALNYGAGDLFSPDLLVKKAFSPAAVGDNAALVRLGQALFYERSLSGNNMRSCASCHDPGKYFTDGLPKSLAIDGHSFVSRNAPSIMYSVYQYAQRWDGSAESIEDQVGKVMGSQDEMNANGDSVLRRLSGMDRYRGLFAGAYPGETSSISLSHVAGALAAFVRSCNVFHAPFDRGIRGDSQALTSSQRRGFNLFMGKAQCGTCHFAPLFNGLTPPLYDRWETEIIGVPLTELLDKPEYDGDSGRAYVYPIRWYERAFKTPGLRNVAVTAPYMHNGAFSTLRSVLDFYNKGGGNGIGLTLPDQTLPSEPLNLSEGELDDLEHFLQSLTDSLPNMGGAKNY